MNNSSIFICKVFEYLNSHANYAVLRNYEGLPLKYNSRDIDILIERKEFLEREPAILDIIFNCGFKLLTLYRSEKIITYVCAYISDDTVDLVQFDFFFNTSVLGFLLIDAARILNSRVNNGAIYHASKEYEFLDKYLQMKILNVPYPEKYHALKTTMFKSEMLNAIIKDMFGFNTLLELDKLSSTSLKRILFITNFRKAPYKQLTLFIFFFLSYLDNFFSYKGYSIGFTGADGSGKTTVIDEIVKTLKKTYPAIELFHFRPTLTPNLSETAQKIKLTLNVDRDFSQPHRGIKTGKLNSLLRLLYYSFDYILGYFFRVRTFLQKRSIVIFDRYYTDIIADSHRSRIFLNHKFLYGFGKLFIPQLDYNILLTADRDVILTRKQELDEKGIDEINEKMKYLSKKKGYYLVMNNGKPEEAVQKILSIVFEGQHRRNMN